MNQDLDLGFNIKPMNLEDFLKSQNYTPRMIPSIANQSNPPLKYFTYDPAQGIWPMLFYYPDYSSEKITFPDWKKEGYNIVSLLNISFTLDPSGEKESIRLAKEILKTYPGTVLFNPRTRKFSTNSNTHIPSSALLI